MGEEQILKGQRGKKKAKESPSDPKAKNNGVGRGNIGKKEGGDCPRTLKTGRKMNPTTKAMQAVLVKRAKRIENPGGSANIQEVNTNYQAARLQTTRLS